MSVADAIRAIVPLETDSRRIEDLALSALVCGRFTGWRMRTLLNSPGDQLERVVHVRGLEILETARDSGRGCVIVISKFGANVAVPLLLSRLGYRLWSSEARDHLAMAGLVDVPGVNVLEWDPDDASLRELRTLRATRRLLEARNMVCMAGDGRATLKSVILPFLGRARPFAIGFAYLAVATDSPAVPVFSTLSRSGRIDLEILPPLRPKADDMTPDEKARTMLKTYVQLLEEKWKEHPGNVLPGQIRRFARLPVVAGGSPV
jgi:lauroyl/myristoyl acyltransferase